MSHAEPAKMLKVKLSGAIQLISQERLKVATQGQSHLDHIDASFEAIISAPIREKE